MRIGIVGHGADKFTPGSAEQAQQIIRTLLRRATTVVSGHSPLGGVDMWAEEIGAEYGLTLDIKTPLEYSWSGRYGFKERNIDIARSSDEVHVIVVDRLPADYHGMRFDECYHCHSSDHVKSGGCWTARRAKMLGKKVEWHIIPQQ